MGILDWFSGKDRPRTDSGLIQPNTVAPVVRYVTALLNSLCEGSQPLTLSPKDPLPSFTGTGDPPGYTQVVNRLKVLCSLNPIPYPKSIQGSFSHVPRSKPFTISVTFSDAGANPSCQLFAQRGG